MRKAIVTIIMMVLLTSFAFAAYGPSGTTTTSTTTTTTTTSGGGGGGGSTMTGDVSVDLSTAGTSVTLTLSKDQKFIITHELGAYSYKVLSVTGEIVKIQSLETFETSYLFGSMPKRFDYNVDGKDDVEILVVGVSGSKAVLSISSLLTPERPDILPVGTNKKERPVEDAAPEPVAAQQVTGQAVQERAAPQPAQPAPAAEQSAAEKLPLVNLSSLGGTSIIMGVMLLAVLAACVAMIWLPGRKKVEKAEKKE
ncbi:MAG: hypothetical protein KKD17_02825 [Nanoarchaeota archaeon]|nr:hypothetical protein [Nanoarchaeota archaeon]